MKAAHVNAHRFAQRHKIFLGESQRGKETGSLPIPKLYIETGRPRQILYFRKLE